MTLLGIGATIGTGVLVLTGLVAANDSGPAVILSFMLAAIVCGFAALCYAEFTSTIPVSGSVYTYLYITIGEFAAHLMGWVLLSVYLLTTSAVASGWSAYFNNFLKSFGFILPKELITIPTDGGLFNLPAIAVTLFITFILSRGTKESKKVNNFMVIVKLSIIVLFIIVGIFHVQPMNWTPFMPYGISGVFAGSAAVFFAFLGFDALATSAEEVKNPQRNLPIGIISSLIVATLIYIIVCLIMTGIVPYYKLNVTEAMAYTLHSIGADITANIIAIGAVIGITAVIFANIYAATRILFSMSRDGLLPKVFSKTNRKTGAPIFSTWLIGTLASLVAGLVDLTQLSNLANIGALLAFGMISISIIIFRKTHPGVKRGFRVPFVPILPAISFGSCFLLIFNLPNKTWLYFSLWLLLGVLIYFCYSYRYNHLSTEKNN
ncbi:amino acid permease [Priestia megaterium]|uniref:amino acid permease n=1 Tax=Priestia megaterium TaxID=1404 RepID=UPI001F5E5AC3|nr:amino acid permease [Priestia megaterium]